MGFAKGKQRIAKSTACETKDAVQFMMSSVGVIIKLMAKLFDNLQRYHVGKVYVVTRCILPNF